MIVNVIPSLVGPPRLYDLAAGTDAETTHANLTPAQRATVYRITGGAVDVYVCGEPAVDGACMEPLGYITGDAHPIQAVEFYVLPDGRAVCEPCGSAMTSLV